MDAVSRVSPGRALAGGLVAGLIIVVGEIVGTPCCSPIGGKRHGASWGSVPKPAPGSHCMWHGGS